MVPRNIKENGFVNAEIWSMSNIFTKKWINENPLKEMERKRKISIGYIGIKRPDLSLYNKTHIRRGQNHPNWNSKLVKCIYCKKKIWKRNYLAKQKHMFCSKGCKQRYFSGKRCPVYGSKNPNWKGGISSENEKIRKSHKYIVWRNLIFKRDNYTCQSCNLKGVFIHAHHKKKFSEHPELRFNIDNGITLCKKCHEYTKERDRGRYK